MYLGKLAPSPALFFMSINYLFSRIFDCLPIRDLGGFKVDFYSEFSL